MPALVLPRPSPSPQVSFSNIIFNGRFLNTDLCLVLIVGVRLYTRAVYVHNTGQDDWAMIAALISVIGYLACIWVLKSAGMGLSGSLLIPEQMVSQMKTTVALEMLYYVAVYLTKLSICLCYLRIGTPPSTFIWLGYRANCHSKCGTDLRTHDQVYYLLSHSIFCDMFDRYYNTMYTASQDVGFPRDG